jgi:hypothetical protein
MFILLIYDSLLVKISHFLLFTPRRPRGTGNIHSIHSKWVNDCCLTPNHSTAICNHSMICFLLSEHAYFGIYGTSSLQQESKGRHYPDSESISLLLLLNDAFDAKIANPNFIVLVWPDGVWYLGFTRHPRRSRWPLQHQCVYYSLQNFMSQTITDEVAI